MILATPMGKVQGGKSDQMTEQVKVPNHVAIIMDGNGRWANARSMPRFMGHREGARRVKEVVEACVNAGVKQLTLYAFSEENWQRPEQEVRFLMRLLDHQLITNLKDFHRQRIQLNTIGDRSRLPERSQKLLQQTIDELSVNDGMVLTLALSYGGRSEIVRACQSIAEDVRNGALEVGDISQEMLSNRLDTAELSDPDLLIRTSGECRVSNFMLWQLAYTEFYFTDVYWPDFRTEDLHRAFASFQMRERRFGRVLSPKSSLSKQEKPTWWWRNLIGRRVTPMSDSTC